MNEEFNIKIKTRKEEIHAEIEKEMIDDVAETKPTIWKKIAKTCLYLLIFLTPLFFLPLTVAPVEINKQFLAAVLVLIALLCYLIESLNSRKIIYPRSLLSLSVLILLVVAGASALLSSTPTFSIFGNFMQPDVFFNFFIGGAIFFLTAVLFEKKDLPRIGFWLLVSLSLTAVFGLFQIFGKFILSWDFAKQNNFNLVGSVLNWGILAVLGFVIAIAVLLKDGNPRRKKIILTSAALLFLFCALILNYQLLWLVLVLTLFILTVFRLADKKSIVLPLIFAVVGLFLIFVNPQTPIIANLATEARPSLLTTLTIAKEVLKDWRVFLGSGPGTFGYNFSHFRPAVLNQTDFWAVRFNQGFSFLATILSTVGILGFLAVVLMIFAFSRESWRSGQSPNFLAIIAAVSFLLLNWFFFPVFSSQLVFVFLGLGLLSVERCREFEMEFYSENRAKNARAFLTFLAAIVLFSFVLFLLYSTSQKYAAAIYYEKGLWRSNSIEQSLTRLEKAAGLNAIADWYWRDLSQVYLLRSSELLRISEKQAEAQNNITAAINAGRRAAELNPGDSLNWSNLGNIYEKLIPIAQADVFAEENYRQATITEPQNPQNPVDLARALIIAADQVSSDKAVAAEKLSQAKAALENSLALKSDYAPAHFLMVQVYLREGDSEKAIAKVEQLKAANMNDAGLAFQLGILYYRGEKFDLAQKEFERAVALNDNYSNARYFLGLIYDQKGQKQKALEQFEKIEKLNPGSVEVEKILSNLRVGRNALQEIVPPAKPPEERTEEPIGEKKENG